VTPDGSMLVTTSHRAGASGERDATLLALWRLPSAELVRVLVDGGSKINRVEVSADGRLLLAEGSRETRVWHLPSGIPAAPARRGGVGHTLLPDHRVLAGDGWIRRLPDLEPVCRLTPVGVGLGRARALSRDGTVLAAAFGSSGTRIWRLPEGMGVGGLDGGPRRGPGRAPLWFTPEGALVAHRDGKIMLWRPRPALAGVVPVGAVEPPELAVLRAALVDPPPPDRAWMALLEALGCGGTASMARPPSPRAAGAGRPTSRSGTDGRRPLPAPGTMTTMDGPPRTPAP
jgi:hypothetical protein